MTTSRYEKSHPWAVSMLVTGLSGLFSAAAAAPDDTPPPPVPGGLVDIGGRRLHAHCTGSGTPAAVVETGSGGDSIDFALVQPEVAKFTQVCTYDRAGYAWRDAGPTQGTVEQTMDDLH